MIRPAQGFQKITNVLKSSMAYLAVGLLLFQGLGFTVTAQSVVINEFMADPVVVSDSHGEWIELRNITNSPQDITGWSINDGSHHNFDESNLVAGSSLIIPAQGFFLVCRNADSDENGGLSCNYEMTSMSLSNTTPDSITLINSEEEVEDQVEFNQESPEVLAGQSTVVNRDQDNNPVLTNDDVSVYSGDDTGTPGDVNIDETEPTVTIDSPSTGLVGPSFDIGVSVFDGESGLKRLIIEVFDSELNLVYGPIETDLEGFYDELSFGDIELSTGSYQIKATLIDQADNQTSTTKDIEVDATAPEADIHKIKTNDRRPKLTGTIDDSNAELKITIDSKTFTANIGNDGNWRINRGVIGPLADGYYNVKLVATDEFGKQSKRTINKAVYIDATAPKITINPINTYKRNPKLTGTVDDPDASITIQVLGKSYLATNHGNGSWSLSGFNLVPEGEYGTFDVHAEAIDRLGNTGTDNTRGELTVLRLTHFATQSLGGYFVSQTTSVDDVEDTEVDTESANGNDEDSADTEQTEDDQDVAGEADDNGDILRWILIAAAAAAFLWFLFKGRQEE